MKTISLFTGAGGLDVGAINAGAEIVSCLEYDSDSVRTLHLNKKNKNLVVLEEDIRKVTSDRLLKESYLKPGEVDLIIGGPPCQSFSKNNYWTKDGEEALRRRLRANERIQADGGGHQYLANLTLAKPKTRIDVKDDERTSLVMEFARVVNDLKPKAFVFENVASLLHPKNRPFFDKFIIKMKRAGYGVSHRVLSSEEFGVAQMRKRVFVTGLRSGKMPSEPEPTHSNDRATGLLPVVPVRKVLAPYQSKKYYEPGEVIVGRWAKYLSDIPPGMNYKALTLWAGYKKPIFEAETRFWNFLLKLHPDKPSWTVPANPGPWIGPLHWENRRLRVPEMAAIQDFPPGYKFFGSRRSVIKQIGNAVPAKMAEAVIRTIAREINGAS